MPLLDATISLEAVFSRRLDIVPRHIAGETILVPVRGELARVQQLFVLDEVGEYVWNLIDGVRDTKALLASVMEEFAVEADPALDDLLEFLSDLEDAGLVTAAVVSSPRDE